MKGGGGGDRLLYDDQACRPQPGLRVVLPRMAKALVAVICTLFKEMPPTCPQDRLANQLTRPWLCKKVILLERVNARLPIVSRVAVFTSSAPLLTRSCASTMSQFYKAVEQSPCSNAGLGVDEIEFTDNAVPQNLEVVKAD